MFGFSRAASPHAHSSKKIGVELGSRDLTVEASNEAELARS
jgi:hypothetical protein